MMNNKQWKNVVLMVLAGLSFVTYAAKMDELLANERNTIEIFQKASPKVVYVHRMTSSRQYINDIKHAVPAGTGSGIVWDNQGHIVTNFHVIDGADVLAVTISNVTVPAKLVGAEPRKDVAVLQIQSPKALALLKDFKPFDISPTHDLMVGQKAIAIGNPFGFDHSMTTGIISALGRQVPGVGGVTIHDMIQTDASINPGNSGGPLLDSAGRLIGLNTVIFSRSGSSSGVGFAVPADEIARNVSQIIKHGSVRLAGIGIQPVSPGLAYRLGVSKGILIAKVLPKSPASTAHLRTTLRDNWGRIQLGDVIVGLNGHPVKDYDALYNLLTSVTVGEEVKITLLRDGMPIEKTLKTIDIAAY